MSSNQPKTAIEEDPFAPPRSSGEEVLASSAEASELRRQHIVAETSIRFVGLLFIVVGIVCVLAVRNRIDATLNTSNGIRPADLYIALTGVVTGFGFFVSGLCLRRLNRFGKLTLVCTIVAGIGGATLVTRVPGPDPFAGMVRLDTRTSTFLLLCLISCLFAVWWPESKTVYSSEYKAVIRQTPEFKHRPSWIVWTFLCRSLRC